MRKDTGPGIPAIAEGLFGEALIRALNDRFRRVSGAASASGAASTSVATAGATGLAAVVLTVPGTLGIQSSAAPLVSLAADTQPVSLVALVKQAPVGGPVLVKLATATGLAIGAVTIPDGAATATGGSLAKIPANVAVVLSITGVGLTFPGADLTVMVRF